MVAGTLRRDDRRPARLLTALARVHTRGTRVDWAAVLPARVASGWSCRRTRSSGQRYWLAAAPGCWREWQAPGHPLLGAAWTLAGGGLVFTGPPVVRAQPWLADHALAGTVVLAGTAFAELAVAAGDRAGCGRVAELALHAPLVVPADGAVQVQVTVAAPGPDGPRQVSVHARPGNGGARLG